MARVRVRVTHPTTRTDGSPLPIAELRDWQLQVKAAAASAFNNLGPVNAMTVTERVVDNVAGGDWVFRVVWADTGNRLSVAESPISVPVASPSPGTIAVDIVP